MIQALSNWVCYFTSTAKSIYHASNMPNMNSASVPAGLYLYWGRLAAQMSLSQLQLLTLFSK